MAKQTLMLLPDAFSIHTLPAQSTIPEEVFKSDLYFIGKTKDELSIVVPKHINISSDEVESDFSILEVVGPLGFSMVGIMAGISKVLADAKVSIFVISTFETDYFLVKRGQVNLAMEALEKQGYTLIVK